MSPEKGASLSSRKGICLPRHHGELLVGWMAYLVTLFDWGVALIHGMERSTLLRSCPNLQLLMCFGTWGLTYHIYYIYYIYIYMYVLYTIYIYYFVFILSYIQINESSITTSRSWKLMSLRSWRSASIGQTWPWRRSRQALDRILGSVGFTFA